MTSRFSPPASGSGFVFRPAAERFHSQLDWLDSWHSFSFSSHVDPAWIFPWHQAAAVGCSWWMAPLT